VKTSSILSEAWRNLLSGTTRALTLAAALALAAVGACLLDGFAVIALQQRSAAWTSSGAAIRAIAVEQGISARSCSALARVQAADASTPIAAAGALAAGPSVTFSATPSSSLPTFLVTPGMAAVLGLPATGPSGVWISDQLAGTLGAVAGDVLQTAAGDLRIAAVFPWPNDGRDQRIAYAVLVPNATTEQFDECWAMVPTSNDAATQLLRTAAQVNTYTAVAAPIGQLNNAAGSDFAAWAQYSSRSSRYALAVLPVFACILGYAAMRMRRLELASARHAGLTLRPLLVMSVVETAAWAVPALGFAAGALALAATWTSGRANAAVLLLDATPTLGASLLAAECGAIGAVFLAQERHLFTYFKGR
jgi:hypothetical protein